MQEIIFKNGDFEEFFKLRVMFMTELSEIDAFSDIKNLYECSKEYYDTHIQKTFFAFGIKIDDEIAAVGGLCIYDRFPYTKNLSGNEGYIFNVYTVPKYRKRGCCERIVKSIIAFSKDNNIEKLSLAASESGRTVYKKCGFTDNDCGMQWYLNE